jgi:hypothetical protein
MEVTRYGLQGSGNLLEISNKDGSILSTSGQLGEQGRRGKLVDGLGNRDLLQKSQPSRFKAEDGAILKKSSEYPSGHQANPISWDSPFLL